jgi:hypothetical protein
LTQIEAWVILLHESLWWMGLGEAVRLIWQGILSRSGGDGVGPAGARLGLGPECGECRRISGALA